MPKISSLELFFVAEPDDGRLFRSRGQRQRGLVQPRLQRLPQDVPQEDRLLAAHGTPFSAVVRFTVVVIYHGYLGQFEIGTWKQY